MAKFTLMVVDNPNGNIKTTDSEDIFKILAQILLAEDERDRHKEHFWVIGLKPNLVISYIDLVFLNNS